MNPRTWVTPYECHIKRDIRQQTNQKNSAYPSVHYIIATSSWKKKTKNIFRVFVKNLAPSFEYPRITPPPPTTPNDGIFRAPSDIVTIQHWGGQRLHLQSRGENQSVGRCMDFLYDLKVVPFWKGGHHVRFSLVFRGKISFCADEHPEIFAVLLMVQKSGVKSSWGW